MTWYIERGENFESGRTEWYVQDAPGDASDADVIATCSTRTEALAVRQGLIRIGFVPRREMRSRS